MGATEAQLTEASVPYEVGVSRYRELARGQICGDSYGMLKLLVSPMDRKLLGVHLFGTGATEIVHIGQAVMGCGGTVDYLWRRSSTTRPWRKPTKWRRWTSPTSCGSWSACATERRLAVRTATGRRRQLPRRPKRRYGRPSTVHNRDRNWAAAARPGGPRPGTTGWGPPVGDHRLGSLPQHPPGPTGVRKGINDNSPRSLPPDLLSWPNARSTGVGEGGLEPPRPCGHRNLNPPRLPNSATRPSGLPRVHE